MDDAFLNSLSNNNVAVNLNMFDTLMKSETLSQ